MRALESTFSKRDSALGEHSADFGGLEATADHQSSSAPKPPKNYESPTATPRILEEESQAECETSCREQTELESTFEKVDSSLNTLFPSLRDFALAKSWQSNSAPAESNQINGACEARNLESVQGDWGVKGGIRGDASQVAPLSPLEKTLSQAKLESSHTAQKADSRGDSALGEHSADFGGLEATADHQSSSAPKPPKNYESPTAIPRILEEESQSSLRALHRKAWQSTSSKNAKTQNADSRIFTQAAQSLSTPQGKKAESVFSNQPQAAGFLMKSATNLKTQQDSRICDEKTRRSRSFFSKSLLCERVQGRILGRM